MFKFAENVRRNYVRQAILHVYIKPSGWSSEDIYSQTSINLEVLKVIKSPKRKEPNNARHLVFNNTIVLPSVEGKWYKINITNVVDEWFRFPRNNLGIEIIGLDRKGQHAVVLDHDYEDGSMVIISLLCFFFISTSLLFIMGILFRFLTLKSIQKTVVTGDSSAR